MKSKQLVVGIDEVGRGCLAGPVHAAAVYISPRFRRPHSKKLPLRDSKKLTAIQRNAWVGWITAHPASVQFAIGYARPLTIDRMNISNAANRAAWNAYRRLIKMHPHIARARHTIFLDGGLRLPAHITHKTIPHGDELHASIMLASIIAKVRRDKIMIACAKRYPTYGFDIHKGYGTKAHRHAILRHGITQIHRRSFLKKLTYSKMAVS